MKRIGWLFCLCPVFLSAQESDIFKLMLKETFKPKLTLDFSLDFSNSVFLKEPIRPDATKEYLPHLGFNYNENLLLLSYKEEYSLLKSQTVSPYLTAPYANRVKFDPNSTETTNDVIANVVLTPIGNILMLNPVGFLDFLMRAGVLPNDPYVPKKNKKAKRLKEITRDVYHIDDDY